MSDPTSPSWYDLLGVAPTASAEEIRTAWRAEIADLDPTDRRFTILNQAAGVLLDAAARTAYDARIGAQPLPADPADAPDRPPATEAAVTGNGPVTPPVVAQFREEGAADAQYAHFGERAAAYVIDQMITLPGVIFLVAGVIALFVNAAAGALLVAAGLVIAVVLPLYNRVFRQGVSGQTWGKSVAGIRLVAIETGRPVGPLAAFVREIFHVIDVLTLYIGYLRPLWDDKRQTFADKFAQTVVVKAEPEAGGARGPVVPSGLLVGLAAVTVAVAIPAVLLFTRVPTDSSVEDATSAAQAAAERAVLPVLSYDAAHIDESQAAAQPYLTGAYRKEYDKLFDGIIAQNAPSTGTVLKAELVRSSVVRASDDRVQVFLLVNQTRTNKKFTQPQVYKNWVTVTMEKVGDDWLVADMET